MDSLQPYAACAAETSDSDAWPRCDATEPRVTSDLALALLSILDLSAKEAGRVIVDPTRVDR